MILMRLRKNIMIAVWDVLDVEIIVLVEQVVIEIIIEAVDLVIQEITKVEDVINRSVI